MRKITAILISILLASEAFVYPFHDNKTCLRPEMAFRKDSKVLVDQAPRTGKGAQKVQRIKFLLNSLSQELRKRNLTLNIELRGVIHGFRSTGIEYAIENADFVTLELPNSTVKNYFEKGPRSVNIWNEFWLGVLRELKKKPPSGGVFGVNDSAIRYPRRRLHFYDGSQIGRGKYVQFEEDRKYNLRGLGQRKKEIITGRELLARLPDDIRVEFQFKKVVHILPQKNPFGKKHLVLFKPVSDSILQLSERLKKVLLEEFKDIGVRDEDILEIFNMHVIEPLLCIYNDYDQSERMLERVRRSIRDHDFKGAEGANQALRLVHIGGFFHNPILQKYLTIDASSEIIVKPLRDPRFHITDDYSLNPKFLESIKDILEHIYFSGTEYEAEVDVEYFTNLITGIIRNDKDFFRRRILLAAIFDRARVSRKRMREVGDIERKYGKEELMSEKSVVYELLDDLSLGELKQLNAALEKKGRIYKTSHRWVLREIVNQEIMDPGEIQVFYVNRSLLQDSSLMRDIYGATARYYNPEHVKGIAWFSPYFSDLIFEDCSPEQRIRYVGEEMIAAEAKKKIEKLRDKKEVFITVIYTHKETMEITIGRRQHGISKVRNPKVEIPRQSPAEQAL